jgi:hypothetical protein
MTDLLSDDTDFEISKYYEARDMIDAGINPAIEKNKKSVFNPETGMNDVLLPMSSGGYVKISEEAPEVMAEAPAQPTMPGASDVAPAQAAAEEAKRLQEIQGSYTLDDLRAAGYNDDQIRAAGLDVIPIPQKRSEPLSEQEVVDIIASGQPIITADPTIRDEGSRIVSTYFFDLAVKGLREDLAEQGMGADEIERTVKSRESELFRNAEVYSNALFGTGATGMEIGAGDFLQAGIMDIQEGRKLFNQQRDERGGSMAGRAIGMAIMAAGVAEMTGVGYAFGKLLKRGAKALEPTLVRMGEEAQVGTKSISELDAERKAARQAFLDNPDNPDIANEYQRINDEYKAAKDALADARATAREAERAEAASQPQAPDTSYRMEHQPTGPEGGEGIRLDDLTKNISGEQAGYPEDFYTGQGMRLYAQGPSFEGDEYGLANQESYDIITSVKGNPDAEVTIYRAVPDEDAITTINSGDFVTLSPTYAKLHAASGYGRSGDEAGKVLEQKVKVRDIYWDGNDVNEFGYFPEEE